MFPYLDPPPLTLGSWRLSWFLPLILIAMATGIALTLRHARRLSLPRPETVNFLWTMLLGGWLGAALGKALYEPDLLRSDPTLLYRYFFGISSFGGIFGAFAASRLYCALRRLGWTPFADAVSYAFPFAWIPARLGCVLAHDHPGIQARGIFTVAYPGQSRYDLGLLELLFAILLAAVWLFWARPERKGLRTGVLLAAFGLFRIAIDPLHVDPPRYAGISVDQAAGSLAFLIGAALSARAFQRP
jgi:phosphatidylglycerol:prolipoprotein diacylglycerol transferase